ncbi:hypothetical protein Ancab_028454 [Ancistrocladus abbreviatus]
MVAGSFSCSRRAVLDEMLKCSEQSTAALVGRLLHQIFQAGLLLEVPTEDLLDKYSRIVLNKNVENLYACGVNENEAGAIPRIINGIKLFKHSWNSNVPVVDFGLGHGLKQLCKRYGAPCKMSIDLPLTIDSDSSSRGSFPYQVGDTQPNSLGYGVVLRLMKLQMVMMVVDIEEMAWAPKYGLKGMIDASVHVRIQSDGEQANEKVMPLEFKTGKAVSNGTHCPSDLIHSSHGTLVRRSDVVGLLMRRNECGERETPVFKFSVCAIMAKKAPALISGTMYDDFNCYSLDPDDFKIELQASKQREATLEVALAEKEFAEEECRKKVDEAKKREASLENDLANMWVLVAKLKKKGGAIPDSKSRGCH